MRRWRENYAAAVASDPALRAAQERLKAALGTPAARAALDAYLRARRAAGTLGGTE